MLKLMVAGMISKDAEVKEIKGNTVIIFDIPHTEKWKDKQGQPQERITWVQCNWWLNNMKIAGFLKKGAVVYVEGEPIANAYLKNGEAVGSLKLRVEKCDILKFVSDTNYTGNTNDRNTQSWQDARQAKMNEQAPNPQTGYVDPNADDLPF